MKILNITNVKVYILIFSPLNDKLSFVNGIIIIIIITIIFINI
jgi:hypothetical protein